MITTSVTCDRCKKELELDPRTKQPVQYWRVSIVIDNYPWQPGTPSYASCSRLNNEWCRACVEESRLLPGAPSKDATPPKPPDIAEVITELVRDLVREELQARS